MTSDESLDREFAYTPYYATCKDIYALDVVCRRQFGHKDEHASGFGTGRVRWW